MQRKSPHVTPFKMKCVPYLRLIPGGKGMEGPASRLRLFERFPKPDMGRLVLSVLSKGLLLSVVWYVSKNLSSGN